MISMLFCFLCFNNYNFFHFALKIKKLSLYLRFEVEKYYFY